MVEMRQKCLICVAATNYSILSIKGIEVTLYSKENEYANKHFSLYNFI